MKGQQLITDTAVAIPAGTYQVSYYSASSGTGKLTFSPDGTNYHDVANTSLSASGDITIDVGWIDAGKWKAVLTGDMEMYLMPISQTNNFGA